VLKDMVSRVSCDMTQAEDAHLAQCHNVALGVENARFTCADVPLQEAVVAL